MSKIVQLLHDNVPSSGNPDDHSNNGSGEDDAQCVGAKVVKKFRTGKWNCGSLRSFNVGEQCKECSDNRSGDDKMGVGGIGNERQNERADKHIHRRQSGKRCMFRLLVATIARAGNVDNKDCASNYAPDDYARIVEPNRVAEKKHNQGNVGKHRRCGIGTQGKESRPDRCCYTYYII